jgi:hypothetical protein
VAGVNKIRYGQIAGLVLAAAGLALASAGVAFGIKGLDEQAGAAIFFGLLCIVLGLSTWVFCRIARRGWQNELRELPNTFVNLSSAYNRVVRGETEDNLMPKDVADDIPGPIRISNWNYAGGAMLLAFIVVAALFIAAYFLIAGILSGEITTKDVTIKSVLLLSLCVLSGLGAIAVAGECPLWVELGEKLIYRTAFGRRYSPLSDLSRARVTREEDEDWSFGSRRRVLVIETKGAKNIRVLVTKKNEKLVAILMRRINAGNS